MDLWVVAAAAGAGYIAKNFQNLSVDKKYSPNFQSCSTNFLQQLREKTCPIRRLARKTAQDDDDEVDFPEVYRSSNRYKEADSEDYNMKLVPSLPPVYSTKGESLDFSEDAENRNIKRANRQMCRLRSTSCLDEKMEEKTCLYSSNISTIGPLLVTDATRGINRLGSNSSFSEFEECKDGVSLKTTNTTIRSSSLDQFEKLRRSKECSENSEISGSGGDEFGRLFRSQDHDSGPGTMLLFIVGMSVGILSAATAWKPEVDKLNKQLQQMQSLVQDLHEELDMKGMVMEKDLTNDNAENDNIHLSITSSSDVEVNDKSGKTDNMNGDNDHNKYAESLELLSKIEAELEAELEMLENNLNESKTSTVVEIDPDFELESSTVNEAENEEAEDTARDRNEPWNYAVSPWELSLRLHELIESRLETRIDELEAALANSIVSEKNVSGSCWVDDA